MTYAVSGKAEPSFAALAALALALAGISTHAGAQGADSASNSTPAAASAQSAPTGQLFGIEGLKGVGFGAAVVYYPAYRGAASTQTTVLPMPYLDYDGPFLKSDKYGLRGRLFDNERLELSVSASLSPPTRSNVPERAGMPDLKPTVELGPQLDITLINGKVNPVNLRVRLPVRQGITVERSPQNAGVVFSPNLNLDVPIDGWNLGMVTGPIFANRRQHAFFYDVPAPFATATRPAYQARGGYSGSQLLFSLSKKLKHLWLGGYVRYDSLHGAAFADSPLVSKKNYVTGGLALVGVYE